MHGHHTPETAGSAAWLWQDVTDNGPRRVVADSLVIDGFSVFFTLLVAVAIARYWVPLAAGYLQQAGGEVSRHPLPEALARELQSS